mmetsp:Transcript_46941/g.133946  ORF Transcript_46941/g.133946 Transcript_46941/m.133946 type:complete len:222 (-) Transcript_46941:34-699(-)
MHTRTDGASRSNATWRAPTSKHLSGCSGFRMDASSLLYTRSSCLSSTHQRQRQRKSSLCSCSGPSMRTSPQPSEAPEATLGMPTPSPSAAAGASDSWTCMWLQSLGGPNGPETYLRRRSSPARPRGGGLGPRPAARLSGGGREPSRGAGEELDSAMVLAAVVARVSRPLAPALVAGVGVSERLKPGRWPVAPPTRVGPIGPFMACSFSIEQSIQASRKAPR